MILCTYYQSPLGRLLLAARDDKLIEVRLPGLPPHHKFSPDDYYIVGRDCDVLNQTAHWLDRYFAGERPDLKDLPMDLLGSEFSKRVWKILAEIPYGETVTYGSIANKIALEQGRSRMSAQAVGQAVGRNPIPIIIPCHRVIGTGGKLTGYTGGMDIKIKLLQHEGIHIPIEP